MDKYVKRIQSRLAHKGIQRSKDECRKVYQSVVADVNNPTEEEITAVVLQFTQPVANNDDLISVQESNLVISTPEPQDLVPTSEAIAPVPEPPAPGGELIFQPGDKQSLIVQQAAALSIQLDPTELTAVVGNVADSFSSFEDACHRIRDVLLTVIQQRHSKASGVLNDTLLEIVSAASSDFQDLNQKASSGFSAIAQQLGGMNTDFKSATSDLESALSQYLFP